MAIETLHNLLIASCSSVNAMVHAMAETKSGPLSPKKPVKEKIVAIYDDFFKVSLFNIY